METTYAELMTASGKLQRAADYLLKQVIAGDDTDDHIASAVGIILGAAYQVRPQRVQ
jgi:hypothetical protein